MSSEMGGHDELEMSVAAFVLGATEPEETALIERHLEGCAGCREMADRLRRAVEILPLATDPVAPPPRLRARILAAAAASPRPAAEASPAPSRKILQLPARRSRTPRPWLLRIPQQAAVAALTLAVVGLGGWNLYLTREVAKARGLHTVYTRTIAGTGALANSDAKVLELRGEGVSLVSFSGLPGVGADKVYELWLISSDGTPDPAGTFLPGPDGTKVMVMPRDITGYRRLALTVEAGPNGSPRPTQPPVLAGVI